MSTRVRRRAPRFPHIAKSVTFRLKWLDSPAPATQVDRETLSAAKQWFERQWRLSRVSMVFGVVLGIAAIVVALVVAGPVAYWPLLIAGTIELTFVPCFTLFACRRYRRMIALISLDLEKGVVGLGEGRVRRLLVVGRSVEDIRTHRSWAVAPPCFNKSSLRPGSVVSYRYAARSALVLAIESETAQAKADSPAAAVEPSEHCS